MLGILTSIYDKKAEVYTSPYFFRNEKEAKRAYFVSATKDQNLSMFAKDYQVVQVANFDNESGFVQNHFQVICEFEDLLKYNQKVSSDSSEV